MQRRHFLKISALTPLLGLSRRLLYAQTAAAPAQALTSAWHYYEITTKVPPVATSDPAQVWIPMPAENLTDMQKVIQRSTWQVSPGGQAKLQTVGAYKVPLLAVQWPAGTENRLVKITSLISTRDMQVDLSKPTQPGIKLSAAKRQLYLQSTKFLPTDGEVKKTAERIVWGQGKTDMAKARAIYEWVAYNTAAIRKPSAAAEVTWRRW